MASNKKLKLLLGSTAVIVITMTALASIQYKTFIYDPLLIWHGSNLKLRSMFTESANQKSSLGSQINTKTFDSLKEIKEHKITDINANILDQETLAKLSQTINVSSIESFNAKTINTFDPNIYKIKGDSIKESLEEAISESDDIALNENQLDPVINNFDNKPAIPQNVLENVEQSTGITPDEVNDLINK